jgi:hypothetical protein
LGVFCLHSLNAQLLTINRLSAALIQGFFSPQAIAFPIQFTLRSRCAGTLLVRPRFRPRKPLSPTREAWFPNREADAPGAFGTTLAAVRLAVVRVSFARPLILDHSATGTRRHWNGAYRRIGFIDFYQHSFLFHLMDRLSYKRNRF